MPVLVREKLRKPVRVGLKTGLDQFQRIFSKNSVNLYFIHWDSKFNILYMFLDRLVKGNPITKSKLQSEKLSKPA